MAQSSTADCDNSQNGTSISFTVIHNRIRHNLSMPPSATILQVKQELESVTNVPVDMQKLIFRGLLSDSTQLSELRLPDHDAKLMLVGTSRTEADEVRRVESQQSKFLSGDMLGEVSSASDEIWSEQTEHKRVLERYGKPEKATIGILNSEDCLAPDESLAGLYDKRGQPLRLRIRPDTGELWLATNDVTHKFPLSTIHDVVSQPIKDHPEYQIMGFQLGPTPKSRFFIYWLPTQYVESVRTMVLQHKILHPDGHPFSGP